MRQGLLRATLVPGGGSGTPENEVKAERGREGRGDRQLQNLFGI